MDGGAWGQSVAGDRVGDIQMLLPAESADESVSDEGATDVEEEAADMVMTDERDG